MNTDMKPFNQGYFSRYCSVYSTLNALQALGLKLKYNEWQELYDHLIFGISCLDVLFDLNANGADYRLLEVVFKYANEWLTTNCNKKFVYYRPFWNKRLTLTEFIDYVKQQRGGIALVCLKTDRLFRNFKNYTLIDEMRKSGQLELHLVQENLVLNKDSKAGDLTILGLNVVMAQNYALSLRDNVVYGMDYSVNQGRCMTKAPAGYLNIRNPDGKAAVIIDSERAPLIQKLFERYATRLYSVKDLATMRLYEEIKRNNLISRQNIIILPPLKITNFPIIRNNDLIY